MNLQLFWGSGGFKQNAGPSDLLKLKFPESQNPNGGEISLRLWPIIPLRGGGRQRYCAQGSLVIELPSFSPKHWVPSREAMGAILTVSGTTRPGIDPTTCQSRRGWGRGARLYHLATELFIVHKETFPALVKKKNKLKKTWTLRWSKLDSAFFWSSTPLILTHERCFLLSRRKTLFELERVVVQSDAILTPHLPNALLLRNAN